MKRIKQNWRLGFWLGMVVIGFFLFQDDKSYALNLFLVILILYYDKFVNRQK